PLFCIGYYDSPGIFMTTMTTLQGENYGYRALVIFSRWLVCALVGFSLVYPAFGYSRDYINATEYGSRGGYDIGCSLDASPSPDAYSSDVACAIREYTTRSYYRITGFQCLNPKYPDIEVWVASNNTDRFGRCYEAFEPPSKCETLAGTVKRVSFQQPANSQPPQSFCENSCKYGAQGVGVCLGDGYCLGDYVVLPGGPDGKGQTCDSTN